MKRVSERKRKQKWIAAVFCALLLMAVLGGCGEKMESGPGNRVVFTTGFAQDEVFRIGDASCTRGELLVYLTTTQNQYESVYGEGIWDTSLDGVTLEENVKETVLAKIAQIKTMYLLAGSKGIVLEETEEAKVVKAAQEYYGSLNETERELLEVSQETVEGLYREYALADKVYHHIIRDINPEISDDEARIVTVQHILISTTTDDGQGNRVPMGDVGKREAYEKALQVHEDAVTGKQDFTELAAKYSDAGSITYSFGKGETEAPYEDAAYLLATDEISPVVECSDGYYIIKCITTFNREETDANKLKIVEQRKNKVFGQEYDQFVETLVRSLNQELWEEISFLKDERVTTSDFFQVYARYLNF